MLTYISTLRELLATEPASHDASKPICHFCPWLQARRGLFTSYESDRYVEMARVRVESGASLEAVVAMLRDAGLSKVESIQVLTRLGMPLRRAKQVVHNSETWADVRATDDAFHDEVVRVAEEEVHTPKDDDE